MMASLPAGWAADYDGTRWFFRYAATEHTQYHFPTPGDEFPDFFSSSLLAPAGGGSLLPGGSSSSGGHGGADLLPPEERMESERQVRKRATVGGVWRKRGAREEQEKEEDGSDEEGDGDGGMCFEAFGYLGPGGYEDIMGNSGLDDDDGSGAHELASISKRRSSVDGVSSLASVGTGDAAASALSEPLDHRTFTIVTNEHPQQPRPAPWELFPSLSSSSAAAHESSSPQARRRHSDEPPMLDSREIVASPVGHIAELVSESTARCEEEINPPPVELPDTDGASWLELAPQPSLVNQYPVELPAVKNRDSVLETLGARRDDAVENCRDQQHGPVVSRKKSDKEEENQSAWQTNWMSTSTTTTTTTSPPPGRGPPRPPKVASRLDLPSRHRSGSETLPRSSPHDESLDQEILDFFPAEPHSHVRALPSPRSPGYREAMLPNAPVLGQFPSVLRPGPRRLSQPPPGTVTASEQHHSSDAASCQARGAAPPVPTIGVSFKAFRPTPSATGRPHAQSIAEEPHALPQPNDDIIIRMPNPKDHVQALRLPQSSKVPALEQQRPPAPAPAQVSRREPFHFVIPVYHSPTTRGATSTDPSPDGHLSHRPGGLVKNPLEPATSAAMVPRPSPLLHRRLASDDAPEVSFAAGTSGEDSAGPLQSPSLHKKSPSFVAAPDVTERVPEAVVESASTSFATIGTGNLGHRRLRQILKRIGRVDRGEDGSGVRPSLAVMGEEGPQPLPHDYIPPKGRLKEVSEWSLGQVG